jgi:hypothetical protein
MDNINVHMFDCAICLVQYSTVKHVEVRAVHCLVQYSTVKHVQVNAVHCLVQYIIVKHVQVNGDHCLVLWLCYIVQDNGQHAPAHV